MEVRGGGGGGVDCTLQKMSTERVGGALQGSQLQCMGMSYCVRLLQGGSKPGSHAVLSCADSSNKDS